MSDYKRTIADLHKGESAKIVSITNKGLAPKLMEMGCTPGESITLKRFAPFGDPLIIQVADYELCLRVEDAKSVLIEESKSGKK